LRESRGTTFSGSTCIFGDAVEIEPTMVYEAPPSFGRPGGIGWDDFRSWAGTNESDFPDKLELTLVPKGSVKA
jgi:hypothetical protein